MEHVVHSNGSSGHEHREANLKLIIYSAFGLAATVAAVMFLMWGTFNLLKTEEMSRGQNLSPLAAPVQLPPEPRLEEHPSQSLGALREREDRILGGYTWEDQKAGVLRIPIDRAIDIVAQKGLPVLNQASAQQHPPSAQQHPQGAKPNAK